LRQAQLTLLRGELRVENEEIVGSFGRLPLPADLADFNLHEFRHPYYWFGFGAIGNP